MKTAAQKAAHAAREKARYQADPVTKRAKNKARRERYTDEMRAQLAAKAKVRAEANKEHDRRVQKAWRDKNKERVTQVGKAWHCANRDRLKSAAKSYREAHKAEHNAWNRAHPEIYRKAKHTRRSRKMAAFVEAVDPVKVFIRDSGRCGICKRVVKKSQRWEIDHIVPLARGGVNSYGNSQLAHATCNKKKQAAMPPDEVYRPLFQLAQCVVDGATPILPKARSQAQSRHHQWWLKNREQMIPKHRAYYLANRDRILAARRARHKEKMEAGRA